MGKKIKKYSVNYEALERIRVYEMEQMVRFLEDDSCKLSSCEIRKHLFDAIE